MKKLFIVAAVAVFGLTACKKEWTCECSNSLKFTTAEKVKKSDADDACKAFETTQNFAGGGVTCKLN